MQVIKSANPQALGDRVIRFTISDETVDDVGDVLIAGGCDFTDFQKNPQFLGFHNHWDFPLGKPIYFYADKMARRVVADVYFPTVQELATDPTLASEKAKLIDFTYHLYRQKIMNAVSVGFSAEPSDVETRDDGGRTIRKWKLKEFSAVPVGMNPNALQEMRSAKSYDPAVITMFEKSLGGNMAEPIIDNKTGAKLSKATREHLDAMAECHKGMCKCHDEMKAHMDEMDKRFKAIFDEPKPDPEPDNKSAAHEEPTLDITL